MRGVKRDRLWMEASIDMIERLQVCKRIRLEGGSGEGALASPTLSLEMISRDLKSDLDACRKTTAILSFNKSGGWMDCTVVRSIETDH